MITVCMNSMPSRLICYIMLLHSKLIISFLGEVVDVLDSDLYFGIRLFNNTYKKLLMRDTVKK